MKSDALHTQDKYMLTRKSTTETVQIAGKWDNPKNRSSWIFWKQERYAYVPGGAEVVAEWDSQKMKQWTGSLKDQEIMILGLIF